MAAVLVHLDLDGGRVHPASRVALAAGRTLASAWGATLYAGVIARDHAAGVAAAESVVGSAGADRLVVAPCATAIGPLWASVGHAWQAVLDQLRPRVVLFGADAPAALELGGRTAARIGARLLSRGRVVDVQSDVELRDRAGGQFRFADSGAVVALIGAAPRRPRGGGDVETLTASVTEPAETRLELGAVSAAPLEHQLGALVLVADDVDDATYQQGTTLAALLGGTTARAGALSSVHPELCITVGDTAVDTGGCAQLLHVSPGDVGELVRRLEQPS